jgi:hypothetical protein
MLQVADGMGAAENVAGLYVRFHKEAREDAKRTLEEGRPIVAEVDYITIVVPGDKSTEVTRPVTPDDKARFHSAWERYVAGQEDVDGISLRVWPGVTRAQVEELAYFKVYTVEQLAAVNDGNLRGMGPYLVLRERAREYLKRLDAEAPAAELRRELEQRDAQLARLQTQVDALTNGRAEEDAAPKSRRRRSAATVAEQGEAPEASVEEATKTEE